MGEHRNVGGGVTLLLAEKVHMLGLQSRDHAKKQKENAGKRLEGNILLMTRHFIGSKKNNYCYRNIDFDKHNDLTDHILLGARRSCGQSVIPHEKS